MGDLYEAVGHVEDGRLQIDRDALRRALAQWEGQPVHVIVRRARAARSDKQNRYLWGVCYALIAEHTGHTAEEIHEWAKCTFLPKAMAFNDGNGEVVGEYVVGGSTTRLNTKDMTDYIEAVRMFALDKLGVVIPEPNEPW